MRNDEVEYYAGQKRRFLIRKATDILTASELTGSFDNNGDGKDDSSDNIGGETVAYQQWLHQNSACLIQRKKNPLCMP